MLIFKNKAKLFVLTSTLLLATASNAFAFGKKPVTPPPADPSVDVIRARWEAKNRDGAAWSQYVYDQIPALAPNLLNRTPADMRSFCPGYASLSTADKKNFWVYLLSAMSELESGQDPTQTYTENFKDAKGNYVVSSGLLQISIESGNAYGCGFANQSQTLSPEKNLACGLRILNKWIGSDGVIAGKSGSTWLGGARYWSVLRNHQSQIAGWTQAQDICR